MNVGFIFFEYKGHHLHFADLVLRSLHYHCDSITIIGPASALQALREAQIIPSNAILEINDNSKTNAVLLLLNQRRFDLLYLNAADSCWLKLTLKILLSTSARKSLKRTHLTGLLVGVGYAYPQNNQVRLKFLKRFILRHIAPRYWKRLFIIDAIAYGKLFPKENRCCCYIPDPIEPIPPCRHDELRRSRLIPGDEMILLCIGVINAWKRVDLLLDAFLKLKDTGNFKLYIIGKIDPDVKTLLTQQLLLSENRDKVHIEDRFVSNEELDEYMQIADAISITYPNFFNNASFYFRSVIYRKPVLLANSGWLGIVAQKDQLGVVIDPFSCEEYQKGIVEVLKSKPLSLEISLEMKKQHEEEDFQEILSRNLFPMKYRH